MEEPEAPYDRTNDHSFPRRAEKRSGAQHSSGLSRAAHGAAKVSRGTARAVAKGSTTAFTQARRFTHSGGAGESGFSRLLELHAFNTAGDAAVAISLAGTLFFTVPTGEATGQVALFLVLTMLPFAVVAPLIGPFLDRFRRGRRWAIGATLAIRAFCCWVLADAVASESAAFYFAALGCLVSSKAYGVTRASAVPRLLPAAFTLVKANSRISLTGTGAAAISAPLAVGAATIGAEWALRYAALLFAIGTVLAILLPAKVDSSEGEEQIDLTPDAETRRKGLAHHPRRRQRSAQQRRPAPAVGLPDHLHGVHPARAARLDGLGLRSDDPAGPGRRRGRRRQHDRHPDRLGGQLEGTREGRDRRPVPRRRSCWPPWACSSPGGPR